MRGNEMEKETREARNRNILVIVRGLLFSRVAFQEIYQKYKERHLRFSDIGNWVDDKGQSLLYNLKEQCHSLFRDRKESSLNKNEWLLDLAIGSIFHEAMKLRENLYQIEVYRPKYLQYKSKAGKSPYEKDYLQQFERIVSKAEQGVLEGMDETRSLFRDAMAQLIDFFTESKENRYLVRFLLEHQPLLRKVYGLRGTQEVFSDMFEKGLWEAYYLAGQSYLQSEHYDLAFHCFSKASGIDPAHDDLQFFLNFSRGMDAYYKNAYSRALSNFAKLTPHRPDVRLEKHHLRKAEEVCNKIASELRDEKKARASAKCQFLAEKIKKML
jgi:hypothetical protein